jgi:nitroimidazol reductase NimA-like FMN-containing flavoprotein (pyridoxamine 5'-phosphate oxidase superfamily)
MRRQDREIADQQQLWHILGSADVCRVAFASDDWPYIVPLNLGCSDGKLYFHCASAGLKLDLLQANPNVCFEVETDVAVNPGVNACNWSVEYRSVIGFGRMSRVEDEDERRRGLHALLTQQMKKTAAASPQQDLNLPAALSPDTVVLRIDVVSMTGKASMTD